MTPKVPPTDRAPAGVRRVMSAGDRAGPRVRCRPRSRAYGQSACATRVVLSCTVVALTLLACRPGKPVARDGSAQGSAIEVRDLAAGVHGGPSEPAEAVISNPERLASIWPATGAPPEIDFSEETVIFVALGQRPTGGYEVEITTVQARGDTTLVHYVERPPGPGCMTTQALTSPYHIIAVASVPGPVRFERETVTREC